MAERTDAVRTIVEAMWEHAENSAVSDIANPHLDYSEVNGWVLLGRATLAPIVRTLRTVDIDPGEVLAAVIEWAAESDEDESPTYRGDYLRRWQEAVADARGQL